MKIHLYFNYNTIPNELKSIPHWVAWTAKKIPIDAKTGQNAKANSPNTWSNFDTAARYATQHSLGVGFQFGTGEVLSGITGVDIDHCINADTGELSKLAMDVLSMFPCCYVEISPSGTGIHILMFGRLPDSGRHKIVDLGLEVYDRDRYFTITGNLLPGATCAIRTAQPELNGFYQKYFAQPEPTPAPPRTICPQSQLNLSDAELISKILKSKQGHDFQSLWNGDTSRHNNDDSSADMALANILAFWTGRDAVRMDALFRQSGLYRAKWDARHFSDGTTYGAYTINKAIKDCRNVYDSTFGMAAPGADQAQRSKQKPIFFEDGQFIPPLLAEHILQEDSYLVERGSLFVYLNGVYRESGVDYIKRNALRLLETYYRDNRGKEVAAYIKTKLWTEEQMLDVDSKYINVKNGLIDFSYDPPKLIPHTPDYKTEIQLPIMYDPHADCPRAKQFFSDVLHSDCLELVEEIFGYFMIPDTRMQKAFLLKSLGESGKSVFLFLLTKFLGEENTSNETLQDLSENRFRVANLAGKLANIFADIPNRPIEDSDTFKTLVAGDWKAAEKKHQTPFKFKNKARLIFSCNEIPRSRDNTHGFFRRWIILDFPNTFAEGDPKRDPNLLSKISTQPELSGLLNLAIIGLQRLLKRGSFITPPSSEKELAEYKLANDSAKAFLNETIYFDSSRKILRVALYEYYKDYCHENELKPFSAQNFYKKVREEYPSIQETNTGGRSFIGIQVNNEFCNRL